MDSTVAVTSRRRVQFAVGGRQPIGLPDEAQAQFRQLFFELRGAEIGAEARNRLQLIERAAGVAERAAGHHGYHHPRGGREWRHDETGLIAHAAGGMLVHFHAGNGR